MLCRAPRRMQFALRYCGGVNAALPDVTLLVAVDWMHTLQGAPPRVMSLHASGAALRFAVLTRVIDGCAW